MDTTLKKDLYDHLAPVWSGSFSRDVTAESNVPDAMPDMAGVIDAEGVITLRSKDTQAGAVELAASLNVSVMYAPEGGGALQSLPMVIPVEMHLDAPGADTDCQTLAVMRVRAIDARMINSRKLSVRADIDCETAVYQRRSMEVVSGLVEETGDVHILTKTEDMTVVADVREKTFVVTDEYPLPAGCAAAEHILSQRAEAAVEDVKYVSGKVVFRGRIRAGILYGGQDGQTYAGRYETEWSQIMEVDTDAAEASAAVSLMFTGVYFDLPERPGEDGKVKAELHLVAQTVCRRTQPISYIADIYSNRTVLLGRTEPLCLTGQVQAVSMRQTVTGSAEVLGGAGEAVCAWATVGGVTVEGETVRTTVNVRAVVRQDGGVFTPVRCRMGAEFTTSIPAGTALQNVSVAAADVYCAPSGSGLDVRVVLSMDALAVTERTVTAVSAVTEDAEAWAAAPAAPSLSLVRLAPDADMWAVAKKYRSTVEAIRAANGERTAGLLLIPKAR